MKTKWISVALLATTLVATNACAPARLRADRLPGQVHDPGRLHDGIADAEERMGNKQAAEEYRKNAVAQRQECNIFTFLIDVIGNARTRACF